MKNLIAVFLILVTVVLCSKQIRASSFGVASSSLNATGYNLAPAWPPAATTCATAATINFTTLNAATVELDLTASDACVLTLAGLVPGAAYVIKVKNATSATLTAAACDWGAAGAPTLSANGVFDDIHIFVQQTTTTVHCYASQGFGE